MVWFSMAFGFEIFCARVRETGAREGDQNPFFFASGRTPCAGVRERVSEGGRAGFLCFFFFFFFKFYFERERVFSF
jgi:hypothetical protein